MDNTGYPISCFPEIRMKLGPEKHVPHTPRNTQGKGLSFIDI
jgi:hypothetical protein